MASWQSGDIEANGIRLHFTRTDGAKPPFVLAHGFSDDGLCWTPVAEALAADYDVIMVDARGHGRSEAPEQGYTSADHAADLAGVIRGLELKRPLVLGHSMGAASALFLAGTYPDLARAILLEDPPPWWAPAPSPAGGASRRPNRHQWINDLKRKTRDELIAEQHAASPTWSDAELGPWADSKLRLSFNVVSGGLPMAATDWGSVVRGITCPALLITADPAHGSLVTEEQAAALQALVPQVRIAHIAGAGHSIRREQFAPYMAAVRGFLADLPTEQSNG